MQLPAQSVVRVLPSMLAHRKHVSHCVGPEIPRLRGCLIHRPQMCARCRAVHAHTRVQTAILAPTVSTSGEFLHIKPHHLLTDVSVSSCLGCLFSCLIVPVSPSVACGVEVAQELSLSRSPACLRCGSSWMWSCPSPWCSERLLPASCPCSRLACVGDSAWQLCVHVLVRSDGCAESSEPEGQE